MADLLEGRRIPPAGAAAAPAPAATDEVALRIDGREYLGWTALRISRRLRAMASDFTVSLSERWLGQDVPRAVAPFTPCTLHIAGELVLTGYVDTADIGYDGRSHNVVIEGRSRTEDIIDCTPDLPGGQFTGYRLDQIARAVAGPFGVEVVVDADVGDAFPDATIQRHETGFAFLERLARLRAVLLTDDERGRLVLTKAGTQRARDALRQGLNILAARARLSGAQRFSEYRVKVQSGVAINPFFRTIAGPEPTPPDPAQRVEQQREAAAAYAAGADVVQTQATTQTRGIAYDQGVPRYRPHTVIAESALDAAGAQRRAVWQAKFRAAQGTQLQVTVQGWRQSSTAEARGELWRVNRMVPVRSEWARIDQEMLIAGVTYELGPAGRLTRLELGPKDGYEPDPGSVRVRRTAGRGGNPWAGVVSLRPPDPQAQ